jgi:hypothetical protein
MEPAHRKELERWAEALLRSELAELRAAGRAIRSLCGENHRLEERVASLEGNVEPAPPPEPEPDVEPAASLRWLAEPLWGRVLIAVVAVAVIAAIVALAAN